MNTVTDVAPAQLAKAALRRLALAKLEPTPENYARAYAEEAGAAVVEEVAVRGVGDAEGFGQQGEEGVFEGSNFDGHEVLQGHGYARVTA